MSQVEEFTSIESLQPLKLVWRGLLSRTRKASFFQSLAWLQCYWQHFGQHQQLRVFGWKNRGEWSGIMPMVLTPHQTRRGTTIHKLSYPMDDWSTFYGPLGRDTTATLRVVVRHLANHRHDYQRIDLRGINREEIDRGRTLNAFEGAGLSIDESHWQTASVIDLHKDWAGYWSTRSYELREAFEHFHQLASKQGPLNLVRHRPLGKSHDDIEPRWDLFHQCVALAQQSEWSTTCSLADTNRLAYFRSIHLAATLSGGLDLNLLRLGERPIGFSYNTYHMGEVSRLHTGYDLSQADLAPGWLLLAAMLEDGAARGDHRYNLGRHPSADEVPWQTGTVPIYRYTHTPWQQTKRQLFRLGRAKRKA